MVCKLEKSVQCKLTFFFCSLEYIQPQQHVWEVAIFTFWAELNTKVLPWQSFLNSCTWQDLVKTAITNAAVEENQPETREGKRCNNQVIIICPSRNGEADNDVDANCEDDENWIDAKEDEITYFTIFVPFGFSKFHLDLFFVNPDKWWCHASNWC